MVDVPEGAVITTVEQLPDARAGRPGIGSQPVWVPPSPTPLEVLTSTAAGIGTVLAAPLLQARVIGALGALLSRPATSAPATSARATSASAPAAPVRLVPDPVAAGRRRSTGEAPTGQSGPNATQPDEARPDQDQGWFGPQSVAWKVHADTSIFVAGMSAFAMQSLHPLALAGVADHGSFAQDFMGRTRRTGEFVSGVIYGSSAEAARRVAGVHRVHERVVGIAPDGRPYSANDPQLLEWVHITEYLAIATAFRRFGLRPLSRSELDQYIAEVAVVGEAMGVADPPRSWAELDAAFQRFRPQMAVGEQAATALRFLREPPGLPAAALPVWRVVWSGAVACLPPSTRQLLGLGVPRRSELIACRALVRALGAVLGPPPPLVAAQRRLSA